MSRGRAAGAAATVEKAVVGAPASEGGTDGTSAPADSRLEGRPSVAVRPASGGSSRTIELTVIGSAPSVPQPDGPGSGILVRAGGDSLLLDCGTGVISHLRRRLDPLSLGGVLISHFHADHYLDLVALRYLLPWAGTPRRRPAVHLPAGGRAHLADLAEVISERRTFFEDGLDLREYEPGAELLIGALRLRLVPGRHYIPSCGVSIELEGGPRIFYSADTGPTPALVEAARGTDLLIAEATLASVDEDVEERGHLTLEEALAAAREAGVPRVLLTHYPSERRAAMRAATTGARPRVQLARPGLRVTVRSARGPR